MRTAAERFAVRGRGQSNGLSIVEDLHLRVIDLHPAFSRQAEISELYAYPGTHLSPAGNRLVADAILESLHASAMK